MFSKIAEEQKNCISSKWLNHNYLNKFKISPSILNALNKAWLGQGINHSVYKSTKVKAK
jgi:hypothetical protein